MLYGSYHENNNIIMMLQKFINLHEVFVQSYYPILNTLQMDSKLHADHLTKVIDLALQGSEQVHAILDGIIKEKLKESSMLS